MTDASLWWIDHVNSWTPGHIQKGVKAIGELFLEHEKLYKEDKKAERKRMYLHHIFNLQSLFLHSIVCARLNNMFLELVDIM